MSALGFTGPSPAFATLGTLSPEGERGVGSLSSRPSLTFETSTCLV